MGFISRYLCLSEPWSQVLNYYIYIIAFKPRRATWTRAARRLAEVLSAQNVVSYRTSNVVMYMEHASLDARCCYLRLLTALSVRQHPHILPRCDHDVSPANPCILLELLVELPHHNHGMTPASWQNSWRSYHTITTR
jgi:hypothetical protein